MKKSIMSACVAVSVLFASAVEAQWTKTGGPPGINITKFYEVSGILFAGTYAQGVYKSTDHGFTWSSSNIGIENMQVLSFSSDSLYLYAGTGTAGVYRSANLGASWVPANAGIPTQAIACLLNVPGFVYAGTIGAGVFRSSDHGNTWTNASGGALNSSSIYSMVYASGLLTVGADNYLFYSPDSGSSWYAGSIISSYGASDFLQQGDTILASAGGSVYITTDGGINWSSPISVDPDFNILGLDKLGDTIYAGLSNAIYRSDDWGQTWSLITSSGLRMGPRLFNKDFFISAENFLISFEEIGIYVSQDHAATWTQIPLTSFAAASSIDNCILSIGNLLFSGTHSDGVYTSPDRGVTWSKTGTNNPFDTLSNSIIFSLLSPAPNIILAGACGYGLYRSADTGLTWTHIIDGLPVQAFTGFTCINSLVQSGTNTIAATTEGLFYSSDNGVTWNTTNMSSPNVYASGLATNGNVVCAGVTSFTLGNGIFRSTDNGMSWALAGSNVIDPIALAADGTGYFYAGSFNDNYYSADNGLSWFNVGPGIPFNTGGFTLLAYDNYLFIGNNLGVYYSSDHAATFNAANTGLDPYPNNAVQGLATDGTYLYAGLFLDAIWRRPLTDFGSTTSTGQIKDQEMSFSISPNPATSFIRIKIPEMLPHEIEIKNILGETIMKGLNQNEFDVQQLPAGIYFVAVTIDNSRTFLKFQKL